MVDQLTKRKPGMIVRASSIKIVSTAMGMAIQDPDARNRDSSQQDKVCELYFHYYAQTLGMR